MKITDEAMSELCIAMMSFQIEGGLEQQIERYLSEFSNTKFALIDMLQMVQDSISNDRKRKIYARDHDDVLVMKNVPCRHGIAAVVDHYVRKSKEVSDLLNEVSDSTYIT